VFSSITAHHPTLCQNKTGRLSTPTVVSKYQFKFIFHYELYHAFSQMNYIEQAGVAVMLKTCNAEGIRFESRPKTVWSVEGMRNFYKVTTAI
jgi:hypothetical protein